MQRMIVEKDQRKNIEKRNLKFADSAWKRKVILSLLEYHKLTHTYYFVERLRAIDALFFQ